MFNEPHTYILDWGALPLLSRRMLFLFRITQAATYLACQLSVRCFTCYVAVPWLDI